MAQFLAASGSVLFPEFLLGHSRQTIRRAREDQHSYWRWYVLHLSGRPFAIPRSGRPALRAVLRQRRPAAARSALHYPFQRRWRWTTFSVPISSAQHFPEPPRYDLPLAASRAALLRLLFRPQEQNAI